MCRRLEDYLDHQDPSPSGQTSKSSPTSNRVECLLGPCCFTPNAFPEELHDGSCRVVLLRYFWMHNLDAPLGRTPRMHLWMHPFGAPLCTGSCNPRGRSQPADLRLTLRQCWSCHLFWTKNNTQVSQQTSRLWLSWHGTLRSQDAGLHQRFRCCGGDRPPACFGPRRPSFTKDSQSRFLSWNCSSRG